MPEMAKIVMPQATKSVSPVQSTVVAVVDLTCDGDDAPRCANSSPNDGASRQGMDKAPNATSIVKKSQEHKEKKRVVAIAMRNLMANIRPVGTMENTRVQRRLIMDTLRDEGYRKACKEQVESIIKGSGRILTSDYNQATRFWEGLHYKLKNNSRWTEVENFTNISADVFKFWYKSKLSTYEGYYPPDVAEVIEKIEKDYWSESE